MGWFHHKLRGPFWLNNDQTKWCTLLKQSYRFDRNNDVNWLGCKIADESMGDVQSPGYSIALQATRKLFEKNLRCRNVSRKKLEKRWCIGHGDGSKSRRFCFLK